MQTISIDQLVGQVLGNYRIERLLGRGRLNAVYFARNLSLQAVDGACALTLYLVPERFSPDARNRFMARFRKEAAAITGLEHPHILPVYEYGEHEGYPYLVTPYMMDGSLADLLKQQGRFDHMAALSILEQLAEGLSYAHQRGFVHGTLRPSNVVQNHEKEMLVAGFGLMHILQMRGIEHNSEQAYGHLLSVADTFLAAPEYVAPEVVQGQFIDVRSDIYALGCILFELLSGRPPFTGSNPLEVAKLHVTQAIPSLRSLNPDVPIALVSVINQALDRDPARRFQQVSELMEAYSQVVQSTSGPLPSAVLNKTKRGPEAPRQGLSSGSSWQLQPPIVTGKVAAVSLPGEVAQPSGKLTTIGQPTLGSPEAWQMTPPIVTGGIPQVKTSAPPKSASVKPAAPPAAMPTPEAPKPAPAKKPAPNLPGILSSMPGTNADTSELVKAYEWWSQDDIESAVAPAAPRPERRERPEPMQQPQEAMRLSGPDSVNWITDPPEAFSSVGSMSSRAASKPRSTRSKGMSRRTVVSLIIGGGVVAAGVGVALNLGHLPGTSAPKTAGGGAAGANTANAAMAGNTTANTTAATQMGNVVGKTTQAVNTSTRFTNLTDKKESLLVHLTNGNFVAYERACTHVGVYVNYDAASKTFICPAHGAIFDPAKGGAVLQGPATKPLPTVKIHINGDGTITV